MFALFLKHVMPGYNKKFDYKTFVLCVCCWKLVTVYSDVISAQFPLQFYYFKEPRMITNANFCVNTVDKFN